MFDRRFKHFHECLSFQADQYLRKVEVKVYAPEITPKTFYSVVLCSVIHALGDVTWYEQMTTM